MSASASIFDIFSKAANDLCWDFDQGVLVPLLEADIVGFLYHRLLLASIAMQDVHLDTRVLGVPEFKYDIVIGPVTLGSKAQKAAVSDPQFITQIKFFPRWGFDSQQDREHYLQVTNDLVSFEPLQAAFPSCKCCELLVDFHYSRNQWWLLE